MSSFTNLCSYICKLKKRKILKVFWKNIFLLSKKIRVAGKHDLESVMRALPMWKKTSDVAINSFLVNSINIREHVFFNDTRSIRNSILLSNINAIALFFLVCDIN